MNEQTQNQIQDDAKHIHLWRLLSKAECTGGLGGPMCCFPNTFYCIYCLEQKTDGETKCYG